MLSHKTTGYLLLGTSPIQIIALLTFSHVIKSLTSMYSEMGVELPSITKIALESAFFIQIIGSLYILFSLFVGYKLLTKNPKKEPYETIGFILILIAGFSVALIVPAFITSIILPIYKLTSEF